MHDTDPHRCQGYGRYAVQCGRRIKPGDVVCYLHQSQYLTAMSWMVTCATGTIA